MTPIEIRQFFTTTNQSKIMSQSAEITDVKRSIIVAGRTGLKLQTLDDVWRFAQCLAKSGLAPKGLQTPEAITIAVQMGMELGLPPMASVQNIAPINGRPSVWGDAQLGIVRGTDELEIFEEWFEQAGKRLPRNPTNYTDDTVAVCRVKRIGYDENQTGFSVADAKRANLWGKAGPWTEYPFRMLRQRARGYALRDSFGDALRGIRPTEEVMDDPKPVEGRVVEAARVPAFLPAAQPQLQAPVEESGEPADPQAEPTPPPRRGRPPKQAPEPPPLELSSDPETAVQRLTRKITEDNLDPAKVAAWLDAAMVAPLVMIGEAEAATVLNEYDALKEAAQ